MPRLSIIVLDKVNPREWRYALWADVPASRQRFYASSTATSVWVDALPADITLLRSGAMLEASSTVQVPQGSGIAAVQTELQARWTRFQADLTSSDTWQRYGSTWDGTTWVVANIP